MYPSLSRLLAAAREQDLRRAAARHRVLDASPSGGALTWLGLRRRAPRAMPQRDVVAVTIRFAFPDDEAALARLAAIDSSETPSGPTLVAESDGELRAALSLRNDAVIADPFHPSVALVELLHARAEQLRGTAAARHGAARAARRSAPCDELQAEWRASS